MRRSPSTATGGLGGCLELDAVSGFRERQSTPCATARHTVAMSEDPVLITIPISHYCEKARWALDRAGVSYQERAHLQVLHWIPVARAGGKKTAPVLVWGDRVFADSADIVEE